jgi:enterochelin esterase family protein
MFPQQVRRDPKRNIRVWLSTGSNDQELDRGSWPLGNIDLANALKLNGYDFRFRFGEGHHSLGESALDLPESLAWLWRDYDPERTEQVFEQDAAEREQPPFRVQVVNRAT